jgi:hypothetical protein
MSIHYTECQPENHVAQLKQVFHVMSDGDWHTKFEISKKFLIEVSSVASRIRDLRLEKYGGYIIERKLYTKGIYQYRLKQQNPKQEVLFKC